MCDPVGARDRKELSRLIERDRPVQVCGTPGGLPYRRKIGGTDHPEDDITPLITDAVRNVIPVEPRRHVLPACYYPEAL